jgi:hypothetical protein
VVLLAALAAHIGRSVDVLRLAGLSTPPDPFPHGR